MSTSQVDSKLLYNEPSVKYIPMSDNASSVSKNVPFEDSLSELQNIVESLESGEGRLEDMIVNYEKGMKLVTHCRSLLESAECSINQLQAPKRDAQ
jgi:exodeoxyribonuclease VII small subunit